MKSADKPVRSEKITVQKITVQSATSNPHAKIKPIAVNFDGGKLHMPRGVGCDERAVDGDTPGFIGRQTPFQMSGVEFVDDGIEAWLKLVKCAPTRLQPTEQSQNGQQLFGIAIPPGRRMGFLIHFVKHDFEHGLGVEGLTFGMLITLQQRSEIKLIDEFTDAADRMIGRKLLIDFFSNRRIDNQASETEPGMKMNGQASKKCGNFDSGACEPRKFWVA